MWLKHMKQLRLQGLKKYIFDKKKGWAFVRPFIFLEQLPHIQQLKLKK